MGVPDHLMAGQVGRRWDPLQEFSELVLGIRPVPEHHLNFVHTALEVYDPVSCCPSGK